MLSIISVNNANELITTLCANRINNIRVKKQNTITQCDGNNNLFTHLNLQNIEKCVIDILTL